MTTATKHPPPQPGQIYERDGMRRQVLRVEGDRVFYRPSEPPWAGVKQSAIWNWRDWVRKAALVGSTP